MINLRALSLYGAAWTQLDDALSSFNAFGQSLLVAYKSANLLPFFKALLKSQRVTGMIALFPTIFVSTPTSVLPRLLVMSTLGAKDSRR
ncbi:hypothetical protein RHM58_25120 [Pseudomonas sp. 10S4]|uniref:hypothetical protein n=1 Tax=Pseudomonas sp. 10S4 TaxID=3048583 RepID=UPI002AC9B8F6|nr:hypothetical protein [Pseudomonas sp. 10S4]WPX17172.1 hypothetical protein RHM58_25120 [Pseudomonas sp. 10S4]